MTLLLTWPDTDPTTELLRTEDPAAIEAELKALGVRFERWDLVPLPDAPTAEDILAAYAPQVARVTEAEGYTLVDAMGLVPGAPAETAAAARAKFLAEHTHADDEDRFFAQGSGVFYLHADGKVHAVLCEPGDLISVPASTTHWFDMGTSPHFQAIRFFHDTEGWVGEFTGDPLAAAFPDFDTITRSR
ncbi:1,2-dihydroxy-3-keto-5-methylthiopentene dioxygenase [Actinokineospora bangkokensis]|uniref:Acireductone dioxygenase n=1 Tax=Actinokineospora bangkokensis TaxID=1193682 RepID=A0A1Q9LM22_9PSEU|nr:cupin [Actinokineospora bangkokensis]OLR93043.1 cupin [Actinokineospora bangkokensis]